MESNKNVVYIGLAALAGAILIFWVVPISILRPLLYFLLFLGSVFLIILILLQRGRGGGLAGALGGMGGYSAFGTRAGDIFTRITIIAASLWILSAMALAKLNATGSHIFDNPGAPATKTTIPTEGPGLTGAGEPEGGETTKQAEMPAPDDSAPKGATESPTKESSDR